jgi:hypothetical protein
VVPAFWFCGENRYMPLDLKGISLRDLQEFKFIFQVN